jgi:hypothetical protein
LKQVLVVVEIVLPLFTLRERHLLVIHTP